MYNKKKYIWSSSFFFFFPGKELLKPWNFLSDESHTGVFYYINEVALGSPLRMGAGCQETQGIRELKLAVPPPYHHLLGGERGWKLNQLSVVNHYYVRKPPQNPKRTGFRELQCW